MSTENTLLEQAYDISPTAVLDITDEDARKEHQHVVIKWAGGEVWLDMSEQSDHFCIDVRQLRGELLNDADGAGPQMKGQGVFTIVNGRQQRLGAPSETAYGPLVDRYGTPVTGHGWNGGYCIILLTDKHGEEKAVAPANSQGNG